MLTLYGIIIMSLSANYSCGRYTAIFWFPDIQECETEADDCDENAECTNNVGTFSCACFDGYSGDGKTCEGGCICFRKF